MTVVSFGYSAPGDGEDTNGDGIGDGVGVRSHTTTSRADAVSIGVQFGLVSQPTLSGTTVLEIPSACYTADTHEFTMLTDLDPASSRAQMQLTREDWPAGSGLVHMGLWISLDSGANWRFIAEAGTDGGDFVLRDGSIALSSSIGINLIVDGVSTVGNPNRRLRGYVINNDVIRTAVLVTAE